MNLIKKKKQIYSKLNSIPSLHTSENLSLRTKEKSKENKNEEYNINSNLKSTNKKEMENINKKIINDEELKNFSLMEENKEMNLDKIDFLI